MGAVVPVPGLFTPILLKARTTLLSAKVLFRVAFHVPRHEANNIYHSHKGVNCLSSPLIFVFCLQTRVFFPHANY